MRNNTRRPLLLLFAITTVLGSLDCGGVNGTTPDGGSCPTGAERCLCYPNSTCDTGLVCASNRCVVVPGSGGAGGLASAAAGAGGGGTAGAAGAGAGAGSGGEATAGTSGAGGSAGGAGASGAGGVAGARGTGGGAGEGGALGAGGAVGAGGTSGTGGASGSGGSSGGAGSPGVGGNAGKGGASATGGAAGGGAAGNAGSGGTSCLQFLTTSAEITAATQGLAITQADFAHDANGNAFTGSEIVYGDDFSTHASVTFESVDTSNQAPTGQTINEVVESPGTPAVIASVSPTPSSYTGFDGIKSMFSVPQTAIVISGAIGQSVPQDSFTLVVFRSDTSQTTMFTIPTTGSFTAGVNSLCGGVVTEVDVLPNALTDASNHMSTYWSMTGLMFGK